MTYAEVRSAILLVAGLYLLFRFVEAVTAIVFLFFAVFLLALALNPIVTWLSRHRVPRGAGAALIALAALSITGLLAWLVIPPMVAEGRQFVRDAPAYWDAAQDRVDSLLARFPFLGERVGRGSRLGQQVTGYAAGILSSAGRYTLNAASVLFSLVMLLILTVYALAQPRPIVEGFLGAVPAEHRAKARTALVGIAGQVRAWVMASLLLGAVIGFAVWLGLTLLGVPNALLLGVLAFFGEFVPNFGPLIAAVPAILIALAVSPLTAAWVVILYLTIQQIENYFLAPMILGRQLALHPVTIAFFVLAMGALVGVVGAILAVPIAAIVKILYEEFYYKPRHPDKRAIEHDADQVIAA